MRILYCIDELKAEASCAVFTRHQALALSTKLLQEELLNSQNTNQDREILKAAIKRLPSLFDAATTKTDLLLDSLNIAHLITNDIILILQAAVHEAQIQYKIL